jgi:ferritin-like metal-binding protein YciE
MRLTSLKLNSLEDLYIEQLRDLYSTESQIMEALPQMEEAASSSDLKSAFRQHLDQTRRQRERLETIFHRMNRDPEGESSNAMEGLIEDGETIIDAQGDPGVRDAGLIAQAQRVEHYEIAGYGCARTFASRLGFSQDVQILQQTLNEEGETDKHLTQLAEGKINVRAEGRRR